MSAMFTVPPAVFQNTLYSKYKKKSITEQGTNQCWHTIHLSAAIWHGNIRDNIHFFSYEFLFYGSLLISPITSAIAFSNLMQQPALHWASSTAKALLWASPRDRRIYRLDIRPETLTHSSLPNVQSLRAPSNTSATNQTFYLNIASTAALLSKSADHIEHNVITDCIHEKKRITSCIRPTPQKTPTTCSGRRNRSKLWRSQCCNHNVAHTSEIGVSIENIFVSS